MAAMKVTILPKQTGRDSEGTPEVVDIHYDLWVLRVTVLFEGAKNPTYVSFDAVEGFRVLDEGQLLEYWDPGQSGSWLYVVEKGGWLELEASRNGAPTLAADGKLKEYLVAGINDCISVLAYEDPTVVSAAP